MPLPLKTTLALVAMGLMAGAAHAAPLPQGPQGAGFVIAVVDNLGDSEASDMDNKADDSAPTSPPAPQASTNLGDSEATEMDKKADQSPEPNTGASSSDEPMENKEYDRETNQ